MINKLKQIKYSRMKPEEIWFLDLIADLEEVKLDNYPNSIFWKKIDKIVFIHDFEYMILWVDYFNICDFFSNEYTYNYADIQVFMKNMVEEYLNWKGFTLRNILFCDETKVEEYINWKGFTLEDVIGK